MCFTPDRSGTQTFRYLQEEPLEKEDQQNLEALTYALATKFLDQSAMKKLEGMIKMTELGQMLYNDGLADGIRQGLSQGIFLLPAISWAVSRMNLSSRKPASPRSSSRSLRKKRPKPKMLQTNVSNHNHKSQVVKNLALGISCGIILS